MVEEKEGPEESRWAYVKTKEGWTVAFWNTFFWADLQGSIPQGTYEWRALPAVEELDRRAHTSGVNPSREVEE
jgi:hypothetical protein